MHFIFIAPMHSYVINVLVYNLHMAIFSRVYSYVTRMLLVCTRVLLVCYSYVLVCYSYVLVCTRRLLVCTRMLLVCYSCVVLVTIPLRGHSVFTLQLQDLGGTILLCKMDLLWPSMFCLRFGMQL